MAQDSWPWGPNPDSRIEGRPNLPSGRERQNSCNIWYKCCVHTPWVCCSVESSREQVHMPLPWIPIQRSR
ncbi:hypothetical protein Gohar_019532 [Gossypium harknessii]|uniref:Uncharacterized protein n=1 Tax=Gossypium harknessii TaxID=34285 RepID=A0A7J9I7N5_9ROSI|nr:hypothetical protein [Gossypium harknessii]